jgi:hypothetical protein
MASHQGRLYHCGAVAPKRSTFADANRNWDSRVFSGLFETMLAGASRRFRCKMSDAVRLIDSTGLRLARVGAEWARSTSVFGAKAHVVYDPTSGGRSITPSLPPTSMTLPPPRRCRSKRARPMSSISAITTRLLGEARRSGLPAGDAPQDQYAAEQAARNSS